MGEEISLGILLEALGLIVSAGVVGYVCTYALRRLFHDEEQQAYFVVLARKVGLLTLLVSSTVLLMMAVELFSIAAERGRMDVYLMFAVTGFCTVFAFFWGFLSGAEGKYVTPKEFLRSQYYFPKKSQP